MRSHRPNSHVLREIVFLCKIFTIHRKFYVDLRERIMPLTEIGIGVPHCMNYDRGAMDRHKADDDSHHILRASEAR